MAEVSLYNYFVREFDIKDQKYLNLFNKYPGFIKYPHLEKDGFIPAAGENIILQAKKVDVSSTLTGIMKKKKKKTPEKQTATVISGGGYAGSWDFVATNERVLAYMKGTKSMSGLLATPVSAVYLRNTYLTLQQPLHLITEVGGTSVLKGLRNKKYNPIYIDIKFETDVGEFAIEVKDVGSLSLGDNEVFLNRLSQIRDEIIRNKRYIADYLFKKKVLSEDGYNGIRSNCDSEKRQCAVSKEDKKGKGITYAYKFSPIKTNVLMYANDLRNGFQKIG
jgi:hypothetical protein